MKKTFIALTLALGTIVQGQESMTPELLWKLGRVSLDDVSPDGKTALYGVTYYDLEANKGNRDLYLVNLKSGSSTRLTETPGSESQAQFLQQGKLIGFTYGGQYFTMTTAGENRTQLTDIPGGLGAIKVQETGDGRLAILLTRSVKLDQSTADLYPNLPKANAKVITDLMYRHWDSWSDEEYQHVNLAYVPLSPGKNLTTTSTDILEGERFDSPMMPFGGSEQFALSPDGKTIVYSCKKKTGKDYAVSTNSELYVYDIATKTTRNLTEGMMGYDNNPKFSPSGKYLGWLSMPTDGYESDVNQLWIMDLATGEKHLVNDHYHLMDFQWKADNELIFQFPVNGTQQYASVTFKLGKNSQRLITQSLSTGDYNWGHFIATGKQLVAERQDMNHATEIFLISGKDKVTQLTHVNYEIYNSIGLSKIEKRMVKTTDGKEMLTWVIFPPNFDPSKKYPTLLYCQGGPQSQVSQFYSFRWNFQLMAAQGYIVVAPNRRGLPGFGKEWNEAISGDWGGQPMKDYLSAIDDVAKEPWSDESKLGAVGASYGGYSVYMLAGIHQNRFKALISHCGLFDLESWYLTTEELFFANYDLGGPFWGPDAPDAYTKFDPKDKLANWTAPILVIHGGKDFRVPENQGMEAFNAAQLLGIPSKFLYFPEEGHWVLSPQNGLIWHDQFFDWLNTYLK